MQATTSLTGDGQYRLTLTMSRKELIRFAVAIEMGRGHVRPRDQELIHTTVAAIDTLLQATED